MLPDVAVLVAGGWLVMVTVGPGGGVPVLVTVHVTVAVPEPPGPLTVICIVCMPTDSPLITKLPDEGSRPYPSSVANELVTSPPIVNMTTAYVDAVEAGGAAVMVTVGAFTPGGALVVVNVWSGLVVVPALLVTVSA